VQKTTVMANWKKEPSDNPFHEGHGRKIDDMARVVADTARPISEVAKDAASRGHASLEVAWMFFHDDDGRRR